MRTLALDIGEVRVGLAVSDSAGKIATPLKVLPADVVLNHGTEFRRARARPMSLTARSSLPPTRS